MARSRITAGRALHAAIAVGIVLALAALWFVAQTAFVRFALEQAVQASDGRLSVEDVEGTLFEGVRIRKLAWNDPAPDGVSATVDELRLRWRPLALLERELDLSLLSARSVVVRTRASDAAAKLPESLELPASLRLRDLRIERLSFEPQGAAAIELTGIELAARYAPGGYRIERLRVDSRWGELQLFGGFADTAPFAISAGAMIEARWQSGAAASAGAKDATKAAGNAGAKDATKAAGAPSGAGVRTLSAAASLDGTLVALRVSTAATVPGSGAAQGLASARFEARPLQAQPLGPIEFSFEALEPGALGVAEGLGLRLTGAGTAVVRLPEGGAGFSASARIEVDNSGAGSSAAGRVPLRSARSELRWSDGRLELSGLRAALLGEGRITGSATVDTRREVAILGRTLPMLGLDLVVEGLDLAPVLGAPQPTRLAGRVAFRGQRFDLDLSDGARGGTALAAVGELRAGRLEIETARLRSLPGLGPATLDAAGAVTLSAPYAASLNGRFAALDPSRVVATVDALAPALAAQLDAAREVLAKLGGAIDGGWSIDGALAGDPLQLRVAFVVDAGQLAGLALRADTQATISPQRLEGLRARVSFGDTRVDASGALGAAGDRMAVALRAPRLAQLAALLAQPGLAGALELSGELAGRFDAPAIDLAAKATALEIPGVGSVGSAELGAKLPDLGELARARVEVNGRFAQLRFGEQRVRSLTFEVLGSADAHTIAASLEAERGSLRLAGKGSLGEGPRWRATLDEASAQGLGQRGGQGAKFAASLTAPVTIDASREAVEIGATVIESAFGRVRLARASWRGGRFELESDVSVPSLGPLARALGVEAPETGLDTGLDDIALEFSARLAGSGLDDLGGTVVAKLASPPRVGASGEAKLAIRDSKLSGTLRAELPSLAFARKLVGPEWLFDGRLRFAGEVGGTLRAPRLAGELRGEALRLEQRALGWRFADGTLAGRFDGDRFRLDSLKLASKARGGGSVEMRGEVEAATLDGRFDFVADRLVVPLGPGQRVVLSGDASASSDGGKFEILGKLRADEGRIEIGGGDVPSLPADVVIAGAPRREAVAGAGAKDPADKLRIGADVTVDLGKNLKVHGKGIDARLGGELRLRGTLPDAPRAFGTVTVLDGRYSAYGQQLQITRGRVIFNGALDNPVLDIVAMRREQLVEAGVSVAGTVLSPQVRLTSEPDVPDAEKLSWLVLGVPLEGAQSGAQGAALKAAAATLFGNNDGGLSGGLADTLGVDVLTVRSASPADDFAPAGFGGSSVVPGQLGGGAGSVPGASASENVVAVGKRLGSRVFLTYEQGLRGAWNLLKIQYDITRRLSLRAQTGTESALDLLYRYPFD